MRKTDLEVERMIKDLLVKIEIQAHNQDYQKRDYKEHLRMQALFQAYGTLLWVMGHKVPRHHSFLNPESNEFG